MSGHQIPDHMKIKKQDIEAQKKAAEEMQRLASITFDDPNHFGSPVDISDGQGVMAPTPKTPEAAQLMAGTPANMLQLLALHNRMALIEQQLSPSGQYGAPQQPQYAQPPQPQQQQHPQQGHQIPQPGGRGPYNRRR